MISFIFQSNQSGIETTQIQKAVELLKTSNRTKVELKPHNSTLLRFSIDFQSNQSGIETVQKDLQYFGMHTSNRTKVELKRDRTCLDLQELSTSNRTKVELKLQRD